MDRIKNSKILITGGAGFIGSNLADALIEDNEVVVVDDLSMGKIENLPQSSHLHFFEHSITDKSFMKKLLVDWKFDYIFLLAAVASVADTIDRPLETHEVNQNANINILEVIRTEHLPIQKLLFASSAAVYGNNPELPKSEKSVIDPLSPYAIDKFATERFVIDYGRLYNIPTVCTRFFNVYGPRQNPNSPYSGVLSIILKSIKEKAEFTILGDGNQTRDFIYITDVVTAMVQLMMSPLAIHDVFNVATGKKSTLNDVLSLMMKISKTNIKVNYSEVRPGDVKESIAKISKLKGITDFEPKFSLGDGLALYVKDNLNGKEQN